MTGDALAVLPGTALANWMALMVFGRAQSGGPSGIELEGVALSARSFALLFADIDWLMTLFNVDE